MIQLLPSGRFDRITNHHLWNIVIGVITAVVCGILALTQPVPVLVICGVAASGLVLALVHPIAALVPLLILGPMRVLISTEAAFQLPLDIGQVILVIFFAAWAIRRIMHPGQNRLQWAGMWTPLSTAFAVFIVATGLSAFVATSLNAWLLEWTKWVLLFVLFTIVVDLFASNSWEWLIFALVLSGVANALVGIYEFFGGSGALHLLINDRYFRAFGTFGQPNPFGGFMGLLIPIGLASAAGCFMRFRGSSSALRRRYALLTMFYTLASLLMIIAIGMSWSRGAWLGLTASLLGIGLFIPRDLRKGAVVFLAVAFIGLIMWIGGLVPQSIAQRLETSTEEFFAFEDVRGVDITSDNFAVVERLAHWQAAANMITAHPFFGVGFGNYAAVYPTYQLINWNEPLGHAHNYYLNIFAEVGIIGLLAYGKVWGTVLFRTWQAMSHPDTYARLVIIGLLGAWIYLAVHSFFDNLYVNNLFLHLAVMLSVLVLIYREARTSVRI